MQRVGVSCPTWLPVWLCECALTSMLTGTSSLNSRFHVSHHPPSSEDEETRDIAPHSPSRRRVRAQSVGATSWISCSEQATRETKLALFDTFRNINCRKQSYSPLIILGVWKGNNMTLFKVDWISHEAFLTEWLFNPRHTLWEILLFYTKFIKLTYSCETEKTGRREDGNMCVYYT